MDYGWDNRGDRKDGGGVTRRSFSITHHQLGKQDVALSLNKLVSLWAVLVALGAYMFKHNIDAALFPKPWTYKEKIRGLGEQE